MESRERTISEGILEAVKQINSLLGASRLRARYERRILHLMESVKDVNALVLQMDLNTAFAHFRDRHLGRGLNFTHLLQFFTDLNKNLLSPTSRGKLVLAACSTRRGYRYIGLLQVFVLQILVPCGPEEFSEVKHQLLQEDVNLPRTILQHFSDDKLRARFYRLIATKAQKLSPGASRLHILSDIDDTFVHSGYGLGGPKYPSHTVLPGVLSLIRVLQAPVTFVTARPVMVEQRTFRSLARHGIRASILCGKLSDSLLIPFAPSYCNARINSTKLRNIRLLLSLFPEDTFLWFGDSGQGDILTALDLLSSHKHNCKETGRSNFSTSDVSIETVDCMSETIEDHHQQSFSKDADNISTITEDDSISIDDASSNTLYVTHDSHDLHDCGNTEADIDRERRHTISVDKRIELNFLDSLELSLQDVQESSKPASRRAPSDTCGSDPVSKSHNTKQQIPQTPKSFPLLYGRVLASYIQDVVLDDGVQFKTANEKRKSLECEGVNVVNNYMEVALHMFRVHKLLSLENLQEIAKSAVQELVTIAPKFKKKIYEARIREHEQSLSSINKILQKHGLPQISFDSFEVASTKAGDELYALAAGLPAADDGGISSTKL